MANEIEGKAIGLYLNVGTEQSPDWKLAVCSTTDGIDITIDEVTTSTKCDGGWQSKLPGDGSWGMNHSGLANYAPGANHISYKELQDVTLARQVRHWKLESLNVGTDGYYWDGNAFISNLTEGAAAGEYLTCDYTLSGTGEPSNTPPST